MRGAHPLRLGLPPRGEILVQKRMGRDAHSRCHRGQERASTEFRRRRCVVSGMPLSF
ncbi:hypothetical protein HMPREF9946_00789 [Acetobacteraceae bacterium AT-5844]|nr:hypothetical protein HMPREF9946_00789 [Acetobacteraceae bacterium AT-5844]